MAVVVTTYNRPVALAWVLASLSVQSDMPSQIVVADDGSGAETLRQVELWRDYLKQHHPTISLSHVWQEDLGFRAASCRNLAVRRAREMGDVEGVIFLDGDCVVPPYFVKNHALLLGDKTMVAGGRGLLSRSYTDSLEQLAESASPKEVVSFLKGFGLPVQLWLSGHCDRFLSMQQIMFTAVEPLRDMCSKSDTLVRTCNLSMQLADFESVGGFDESFVGWGLEDTDLAVRLIASGVRVRSGRFATNVFHLWHPERSRAELQGNASRLALTRGAASARVTTD